MQEEICNHDYNPKCQACVNTREAIYNEFMIAEVPELIDISDIFRD